MPRQPEFYECSICGGYHRATWDGDCREDQERFTLDDLDERYGSLGWTEVDVPDGELPTAGEPITRFGPSSQTEPSITTYQRVLSYLDGGVEWAACRQDGERHESLIATFRALVAAQP